LRPGRPRIFDSKGTSTISEPCASGAVDDGVALVFVLDDFLALVTFGPLTWCCFGKALVFFWLDIFLVLPGLATVVVPIVLSTELESEIVPSESASSCLAAAWSLSSTDSAAAAVVIVLLWLLGLLLRSVL